MSESVDAVLESLCDDPGCGRERLLHTAGIFYAERGYDAASTRELTAAAGVNLAAIAYYFGGKDGLQDAVVDHVVKACRARTWRIFEDLSDAVDQANGDRWRLAGATAAFADGFLRAALPGKRETWWVTVLVRAMGTLSASDEPIYKAVFKPANQILQKLVKAATGESDADRLGVTSEALAGDFLTFCKNRSVVLRSLGWNEYSPERVEQVIGVVTQRMLSRLALPHPETIAENTDVAAE